MARLFMYLAGPHVSPLMFLPATNPQPLPKFPLTLMLGGLHPSLEGRGDVATSSGVGDLKEQRWLAYNRSIPRAVGAMIV